MIRPAALRPLATAATLLAAAGAAMAQSTPTSISTAANTEASGLRQNDALIKLEYQTIKVPGDRPIDLASFHVFNKVLDGVYIGAGFYAPLLKGAYGGFVAADLGAHLKQPLAGPLFLTAGLSAGGGGGGRSVEHSKLLSGSGGFTRGYLGLGYDFGSFSVGATVSRMKFRQAIIDGTQASVFLEMPFSYLTGPFSGHEQPLPPEDDRRAAREMGENMLTLSADNYRQRSPQGSNKSTISLADLQYAHFFSTDSYWFAALGMAYRGLPLYNQLLGGVGQRWKLSPALTLYGQLGLGSGGYAPDIIDTDAGLLIYPKLQAEYALSRDLGLAVSLGYMAAPKGSSRNQTFGLSLIHHLRSGGASDGASLLPPASYQGLRLAVLQQTDYHLSYRDIDRSTVKMMGLQLDIPLGQRFYLPLQASGAYNAYLGYPGYAEILAGLGVQTLAAADERWQGFGQLMAGANVHGKAVKANAGIRYILNERLALSLSAGRIEARSSTGGRFHADNIAFGLDYRFAIPTR
ncbi:hypothetical protein RQP53_14910 [Paucibacter sp. APW11]|uniref:Outer membrane protein beta-barrel domain-containing protein n=1 Tax=Roseateles aquae TaxID=3077235 RepID=A0ABU3PEK9_9BURK|nr:hypothetical protein [Paucibacter sp. APW11]MDT9000562.1 hypothetical protein [Paucibacter sp. APW11]